MRALLRSGVQFQSTLPARGATEWLDVGFNVSRPFQSTLPARGPSPVCCIACCAIHFNPRSPHGERLAARSVMYHAPQYFNPRSPHGERLFLAQWRTRTGRFQSTLPARGATIGADGRPIRTTFQSTLPARGATGTMVYN